MEESFIKVRKKGEPITKDKKMKDCYWGSPLI
jgi:hypothetical protein